MPYASDKQRKLFHAMLERGEIDRKTVDEFDHESRGKELPERVVRKPRKRKKLKRREG